jgi:hypothetical protein
MITTEALRDWLAPMVPDVKFEAGPDMPDKPDRAAMITRGPGGRSEMESLLELGSFTVRMRGLPTRISMPEQDLGTLRTAIEATPFPLELGGHAIVSIWPSGPWYPLPGPDSGRRYEFVQVFQYKVSTDI